MKPLKYVKMLIIIIWSVTSRYTVLNWANYCTGGAFDGTSIFAVVPYFLKISLWQGDVLIPKKFCWKSDSWTIERPFFCNIERPPEPYNGDPCIKNCILKQILAVEMHLLRRAKSGDWWIICGKGANRPWLEPIKTNLFELFEFTGL